MLSRFLKWIVFQVFVIVLLIFASSFVLFFIARHSDLVSIPLAIICIIAAYVSWKKSQTFRDNPDWLDVKMNKFFDRLESSAERLAEKIEHLAEKLGHRFGQKPSRG